MELFEKIVNGSKPLIILQKVSSEKFDPVLNIPLLNDQHIQINNTETYLTPSRASTIIFFFAKIVKGPLYLTAH